MTAAMVINLANWGTNRGLLFGPRNGTTVGPATLRSVIAHSTIEDVCDSQSSLYVSGTKSLAAIDLSTATLSTHDAIRLPYQGAITWLRSDSTFQQSIRVDAGNSMIIGEGTPNVAVSSNFYPTIDNSFPCGFVGGGAWSEVASYHYSTVSDRALKCDISAMPDITAVVMAIEPKTFRYKIGGYDRHEAEEETDVPVFGKDGRQLTSNEFVLGDDGQPVFAVMTSGVVRDKFSLASNAPEVNVQRTRQVPATERKLIKTTSSICREGRRRHSGFIADEILPAFQQAGIQDFGGYVKAPDQVGDDGTVTPGLAAIRSEQMIAVLWKALQETIARVQTLERSQGTSVQP